MASGATTVITTLIERKRTKATRSGRCPIHGHELIAMKTNACVHAVPANPQSGRQKCWCTVRKEIVIGLPTEIIFGCGSS